MLKPIFVVVCFHGRRHHPLGGAHLDPIFAFVGAGILVTSAILLVVFRGNEAGAASPIGSFQGFGTLYYGWRHWSDGTATATKWIVGFWLPLVPFRRHRLRVLTDFSEDLHQPLLRQYASQLVAVQYDRLQVLETLPLSLKEVAITLAKTYLGLPLLLVCPPAFIWQVVISLRRARGWQRY